jgi:sterol desaturase/sphingolipid hydroxylase (fatty acid hydroxylase superfamily)
MHFCCHIDENYFVRYMPLVNTLRRHHTAHHHSRLMMEKNMNLTFPVADWLFGTSDLDRGLLGHLFNGYSERHLKSDLKGRPQRPDIAAADPITH